MCGAELFSCGAVGTFAQSSTPLLNILHAMMVSLIVAISNIDTSSAAGWRR
jgi:hypothetical protein